MNCSAQPIELIYLIATPFNKRDRDRFGIDIMRNQGFEVKIWDVFPIIRPDLSGLKVINACSDSQMTQFVSFAQFEEAILKLRSQSVFLAILPVDDDSLRIYKIFNANSIPYIRLVSAQRPPVKRTMIDLIRDASYASIINKLLRKNKQYLSEDQPIALIGKISQQQKNLYSKSQIIDTHALDYDLYLQNCSSDISPIVEDQYAVFVDIGQAGSYHQDIHIGRQKEFISSGDYFDDLNHYLDYFEKTYCKKVIIAAHPRVIYEKNVYGERKIVYNKTIDLIRGSSIVLMHHSLAVNFAVLFNKPIIFILYNQKFRQCSRKKYPKAFSNALGSTNEVTMGESSSYYHPWVKLAKINYGKYKIFKESYIKNPETPLINSWEILSQYLNEPGLIV